MTFASDATFQALALQVFIEIISNVDKNLESQLVKKLFKKESDIMKTACR